MAENTVEIKGVIQCKKGKLYAVLSWYDHNKRKQKWVSTGLDEKGNRRKAQTMLPSVIEEYQAEIEASVSADATATTTLLSYLQEWLNLVKHSLALTTYTEYRRLVNDGITAFFQPLSLNLNAIKPLHLQQFYNYLMEAKRLSPQSVRRYHAVLHKALNYAVKLEYLASNPADKVDLPKTERYQGKFLSADEVKRLLQISQGTKMEYPIRMAVWYGMRRGEVCGLKWQYVDFEHRTIEICGVITDVGERSQTENLRYVPTTKTKSSHRTLPMFDAAYEYLMKLKTWQEANRELCGSSYNHDWDEFVCVDRMGNLIQPEYITYTFPIILERGGFPRVRFHDLRHTNATLLLSNGAPMKDVQAWLGHSNYSTTADIYAHVMEANKMALGQMAQALIAG